MKYSKRLKRDSTPHRKKQKKPLPVYVCLMEFDKWKNGFKNYHLKAPFWSCKPKVISKTVFIALVKFLIQVWNSSTGDFVNYF